MNKWINVNDNLPNEYERVLVVFLFYTESNPNTQDVDIGFLKNGKWISKTPRVTYW
jgi:hypothetical protein